MKRRVLAYCAAFLAAVGTGAVQIAMDEGIARLPISVDEPHPAQRCSQQLKELQQPETQEAFELLRRQLIDAQAGKAINLDAIEPELLRTIDHMHASSKTVHTLLGLALAEVLMRGGRPDTARETLRDLPALPELDCAWGYYAYLSQLCRERRADMESKLIELHDWHWRYHPAFKSDAQLQAAHDELSKSADVHLPQAESEEAPKSSIAIFDYMDAMHGGRVTPKGRRVAACVEGHVEDTAGVRLRWAAQTGYRGTWPGATLYSSTSSEGRLATEAVRKCVSSFALRELRGSPAKAVRAEHKRGRVAVLVLGPSSRLPATTNRLPASLGAILGPLRPVR